MIQLSQCPPGILHHFTSIYSAGSYWSTSFTPLKKTESIERSYLLKIVILMLSCLTLIYARCGVGRYHRQSIPEPNDWIRRVYEDISDPRPSIILPFAKKKNNPGIHGPFYDPSKRGWVIDFMGQYILMPSTFDNIRTSGDLLEGIENGIITPDQNNLDGVMIKIANRNDPGLDYMLK